ncbi:ABC transporter substrate-binding protein [Litoribrevibacter albus]|uniref:Ferrichrome ABC transporter substrate-binding protein n=1 Tax=Litoribrevibacter albus TaxID=1473156 RepID=A0AA37SDW6_9GAMM|nr:iron-siderophore ABC transporter substrate-binding protein [Litoribrevibacter albus]GLQ32733.1 ferrichrome ABC transporter substrate-binding protein [Litoribrevibacter albus]
MRSVIQFGVAWLLLCFSAFSAAISFPHDLGVVELEQTPTRVVALNWSHAEMLLSLGVTPVGVTNISGYKKWQSNNPVLPDSVEEVGFRASPDLRKLRALKPDLIVGYRFRHQRIYKQLSDIAPTLIFNQYPHGEDQDDYPARMQRVFLQLADVFDKRSQAQVILDEMDEKIRKARLTIEAAGLNGQPVVFGKFVGMGLGLRVYNDHSLAGATINRLGLDNRWQAAIEGRDFSHIPLSQMYLLGDANLIYVGDLHKEGRRMIESPVWPLLPFVQRERTFQSPALWSFGGPESAVRMAENIAQLLTQATLENKGEESAAAVLKETVNVGEAVTLGETK